MERDPLKRRPRYPGTHPRRFEEKHKELDPAANPSEIEKVRARGQTPAGTHVPALLRETVEALRPKRGAVVLDCTLGYGGHAEAIALLLGPAGFLIGLDLDATQLERTRTRLVALGLAVRTRHTNFAGAAKALREEGVETVDGLLADLGASSMQYDDPARGFSYKHDGPLDMRLDRSRGPSAFEWLRTTSVEEVEATLHRFGDEPDAVLVAEALKALVEETTSDPSTRITSRTILKAKGLPRSWRRSSPHEPHPAAKTFQALRIAVNREFENLRGLLRDLPWLLKPHGRAAIITFHSGEEALVEQAFREGEGSGLYAERAGPLRPSPEEIYANPRARSSRLWWAERSS